MIDAIEALETCGSQKVPAGGGGLSELTRELGDVLFDTLMLTAICTRDFAIDPDVAWQAAAEKVSQWSLPSRYITGCIAM